MAVFFGQGASYDSMQGRFREYRRTAESMKGNTSSSVGSTPSRRNRNPTTPRSARGRVTKTTPSKSKQSIHRGLDSIVTTPTKMENNNIIKMESSVPETILLDDDDDDDDLQFLKEEGNGNRPPVLSFGNRDNGVGTATIKSEPVARMVEVDMGGIKRERRAESRVDSRTNGYVSRNGELNIGPSSWPDDGEEELTRMQPRARNAGIWETYDEFDDLA